MFTEMQEHADNIFDRITEAQKDLIYREDVEAGQGLDKSLHIVRFYMINQEPPIVDEIAMYLVKMIKASKENAA